MYKKYIPYLYSFCVHLLLGSIMWVWVLNSHQTPVEKIEFTVLEKNSEEKIIESKPVIDEPKVLSQHVTKQKTIPSSKPEFGLSKQTLTAPSLENTSSGVSINQGNTLMADISTATTKSSGEALQSTQATEAATITKKVSLIKSFEIPYPSEARRLGVQGPVVMRLRIGSSGKVEQVELIKGQHPLLDEAAMQAIQKFIFQPAYSGDQAVATHIRYTYKFVLEK